MMTDGVDMSQYVEQLTAWNEWYDDYRQYDLMNLDGILAVACAGGFVFMLILGIWAIADRITNKGAFKNVPVGISILIIAVMAIGFFLINAPRLERGISIMSSEKPTKPDIMSYVGREYGMTIGDCRTTVTSDKESTGVLEDESYIDCVAIPYDPDSGIMTGVNIVIDDNVARMYDSDGNPIPMENE